MKHKKVLGLILSLVLVLCVAIPGTLASENLNQPALICEKTEHVHGDGCWTVPETPACGMEAGAGAHTHGDGCYGTVTSMSCTLPEDENHTHGDGCYVSQTVITCSLAESAGHVHDAGCYPAVLSCTLEEHTHNAECYAAPVSDVEDAEPTCTCGSVDGTHIPGCALYVAPTCTCGSVDGIHVEGCALYVAPTCTCGSVDGIHVEGCPLYVAPTCTCGSVDGIHVEGCPLYVAPTCTCGSVDGTHVEGCPLYVAPVEEFQHIEGCSEECTDEECTCLCHVFKRLMECENYDEFIMLLCSIPEENLLTLTDDQITLIEEKLLTLEPQPLPETVIDENGNVVSDELSDEPSDEEPFISEVEYLSVNFDYVAPFGDPVVG